jgi:hypothetical protein
MTPKEKAKELVEKYASKCIELDICLPILHGKVFSLIAVDEIIKAIDFDWMEVQNLESEHRYWDNVKQEIEKL